MRLTVYSSLPQGDIPNLVALQDEVFTALPTVLVCPLKMGMTMTSLRVGVPWGDEILVACPELARPIRRTVLRPLGLLDSKTSGLIMQRFLLLLAQ